MKSINEVKETTLTPLHNSVHQNSLSFFGENPPTSSPCFLPHSLSPPAFSCGKLLHVEFVLGKHRLLNY